MSPKLSIAGDLS